MSADDLGAAAGRVYDSIQSVKISRGVLDSDPIVWELNVSGKTLKIDAEKLETVSAFRTQFLRAFNHPAPRIKNEDWQMVIELLASDEEKTTVEISSEETEPVYIARELYAFICGLPRDGDKDDLLSGGPLYFKDGLYWLKTPRVAEIVKDLGFKFIPNQVSTAMTSLGLKEEGTKRYKHQGTTIRAWGFKIEDESDDEETESDCSEYATSGNACNSDRGAGAAENDV